MTPWDAPPDLIEGTDGQAALGNKYIRKITKRLAAFETGRAKSREVVRDRQVRLLEEVRTLRADHPGSFSQRTPQHTSYSVGIAMRWRNGNTLPKSGTGLGAWRSLTTLIDARCKRPRSHFGSGLRRQKRAANRRRSAVGSSGQTSDRGCYPCRRTSSKQGAQWTNCWIRMRLRAC